MSHAPYAEATWKKILDCGQQVEASLRSGQIALTMGGEPTFVPLQPQGAEWQTSALGPTKLGYARRLGHALIERAYPGAVLLETSGKLFPGEVLPRWTLLLQWRADGVAVWRDPTRLRSNTDKGSHDLEDSRRLILAIAESVAALPALALACVEAAAPNQPIGYVLPLDRTAAGWISDDWREASEADPLTRGRGSVAAIPGDSLLGLRLPLGHLPEPRLRRALTAEVRDGTVMVFLPPVTLEAYLELLGKLESCLETLGLRDVVLAGYAPPPNPALPTIGLASDPGVIEINLAVCASWADYDQQLNHLYGAASRVGLVARKLQFNGLNTGTGGGAHLVFGGPIGLTSPFFVWPGLLPSAIRYWQHHPALSYAFAGQYLGPSSQAPRIDESTFEALYELEIACDGAARLGSPANLSLFDLLFRDLLMDRTGNTHRAEISVDKFWNPFAGNGRLGLIEFRAFESHPASAAQSLTALFVRAILARLAADPFTRPFIRWNGALHDRFFLASFVREDLSVICEDLRAHGMAFDGEWLAPLLEWRFPKLGEFTLEAAEREEAGRKIPSHKYRVEFRQALEAWPLLGEQPSGTGTVRTVDSSADRIEAFVDSADVLERGVLLVNGLPCAFRPVDGGGAAAGIRFRAFYLYPALHPHVPVHAPLLLEWVDRATLTVAAAARWHVWDPKGVGYAARPTDEAEAAARFASRWEPWTQTLGQPRFIPSVDYPPEGRHTLDLRRYPSQSR